jgi:hypothetical protein
MRYTKLVLVVLGFAATLSAADSFVGTWKMNPNKTVFKNGTSPFQQTVTITETGSNLNVKVAGTAVNGEKISVSYTVPVTGGPGKIVESSEYDGISGNRIGPNEREMTYMKGGKAIYTTHSVVSTDGNTLSVASKGVNPLGDTVEGTVVYDKQK